MTKKIFLITFLFAAAAVGVYFVFLSGSDNTIKAQTKTSSETEAAPVKKERKILYYRAPMNPSEVYDKPGKSRMGMDLVPVYEDAGGDGVVTINAAIQQNMNVKIDEVEEKTIYTEIVTNGILRTDERKEYIVTTKIGGWIEKMYVNYTGQEIKEGEKLIDIYSPELVAAEQEYLTAIDYSNSLSSNSRTDILTSGSELIKNAKRKLELFDIPEEDIENLKRTRDIKKYMTLFAPFDGTVIFKGVIEGQKINPGEPLLKIADLKNLWLIADVYEYELSKIKVGSEAEIQFSYLPGKVFHNKISFIYPTLEAKTRTVKVRLDIKNRNGELKPDMYADVVIRGKKLSGKPTIPEQAIIRSGRRSIVILALGNGRFKPVDVKLGEYAEGYYQILDGISAGNKIATSAQFLIDSESSLRSAVKQFRNESETKSESSTSSSKDGKMEKDMSHDHSTMDMDGKMDHDDGKMDMDMNKDHGNGKMDMDKKMDHDMDMSGDDHSANMKHDSIVRTGVIDVASIDKNKDGKVFQDIMDWNVISDKPGRCPICNMKLRE
jgi:RND family efflux transporter MFP subunit